MLNPDYFNICELLDDEHLLIQQSVKNWVEKKISPIIEKACQDAGIVKIDKSSKLEYELTVLLL